MSCANKKARNEMRECFPCVYNCPYWKENKTNKLNYIYVIVLLLINLFIVFKFFVK